MKKVVISNCFGGFSLSPKAIFMYAELAGFKVYPYAQLGEMKEEKYQRLEKHECEEEGIFIIFWVKDDLGKKTTGKELNNANWFHDTGIDRDGEFLIKVVEILGVKANGRSAALKIVEIPKDVDFIIEEYDGNEHLAEQHKTWS